MLLESYLPDNLVRGDYAWKLTLTQIDEIQNLWIQPFTTIKMHGHDDGQWEIWVVLKNRKAFICMPGQKHEFVNLSKKRIEVLAIKGTSNSTYEQLEFFVKSFDLSAECGSVIIDD